jgi:subtilisin family serine protease
VHDHGTHVAGILAADDPNGTGYRGMCPDLTLYDFRVLDAEGRGEEFAIIAALQFIRYINARADQPLIHGVNLSLSLLHDVENYACGRTPICDECERLVASGVVVVAAAGNRGYERVLTSAGELEAYRAISITDPGNAESVITVGATHRFQPHAYGVSYFSSRGPTGDGRIKPDILGPGERVYSTLPNNRYGAKDGTSMAAPHVSGVAALLMARHREFVNQPARVKKIICSTATDLGRERYFQGYGMVDALRALQSV